LESLVPPVCFVKPDMITITVYGDFVRIIFYL
jgi:hypothetical protein